MPVSAKVFIAEDDDAIRMLACDSLHDFGHVVVMSATNIQEALGAVPILKSLGVNVAVVDGNLSKADRTGKDGMTIAAKIRELGLGIKIIAWSGQVQNWGDLSLLKPCSTIDLAATVTRL